MRLRFVLAMVLAAAGLAGCATSQRIERARSHVAVERHEIVVSTKTPLTFTDFFGRERAALGLTWYVGFREAADRIEINSKIASDLSLAGNVCAHELGHALGLEHYTEDGWMYPGSCQSGVLFVAPTRRELKEAAKWPRSKPYVLVFADDADSTIVASMTWAAERWNEALGWQAITVLETAQ